MTLRLPYLFFCLCALVELVACEMKIKPKHLHNTPRWHYSTLGTRVALRGPLKLVYRKI